MCIRRLKNCLRAFKEKRVSSVRQEAPCVLEDGWEQRDVLIGTFRSRMQFSVCRDKCFYYIPAHRLEETDFPVRWVAAFQTPRVFGRSAGISWYGEVVKTEQVIRASIREVPRRRSTDPEMPYYRFTIARWIRLKRRILPIEAGFVHAFTTMPLLLSCEYVPELLFRTGEEYDLYLRVKEQFRSGSDGTVPMGNAELVFRGGEMQLLCSGRELDRSTAAEFRRYPVSTFRRLLGSASVPAA